VTDPEPTLAAETDSPSPAGGEPARRPWLVWAVATAYLGVLLTSLDTPLWLDEAWVVEDLLGTPLLLPGQSVREAAYEWLLQSWMLVAGASIASLRLLMIGFSMATVWALARAARPAQSCPGATLLVFTSFPVIVHFAVEINRYAELALGATLCVWACLELARRPRVWPCVGLVVAGAASFHIHNTAAVTLLAVTGGVLALHALVAPAEERRARVAVCLGVPLAQLLLVLPGVPALLGRAEVFGQGQKDYLAHVYSGLTPSSLARVLREVGAGGTTLPPAIGWAGVLVLLALVIAGLRRPGRARLTLAAFACGPPLAAALASFAQPMFVARVLIPALPATALLAARGLPQRPALLRGIALALALTTWAGFLLQPWPGNVRPVLQTLSQRAQLYDGLVVQPPFARVVLRGNLRVSKVRIPQLTELDFDAPTRMQAARLHYGDSPQRTWVVLHSFRDYAQPLADELPLRFAKVSHLTRSTGYTLLLCEGPLPPEQLLQRCREPEVQARSPALAAFREGSVLLHTGRVDEALACFARARDAMPTGLAHDEREAKDDRAQLAWATAWASHRAGKHQQARVALAEAEELGTTVPPAVREAILGR